MRITSTNSNLALLLLLPAIIHAEEPAPPIKAGTYITRSLEVPAFTPPAPVARKVLPAVRADATMTFCGKSGTTLTVIRGEASSLPDLPPPPEPPSAAQPLPPDAARDARITWAKLHNFNLGATIYDHSVSTVHWNHPLTGEPYQAICGFDIGLVAGLGQFIHNGEKYNFMAMFGDISTVAIRRLAPARALNFPTAAANSIVITKGNPEDKIGTSPLLLLKDLIDTEKDRLITYQAARQTHQRAAAIWAAAHPPIPRDETILLRPHRGSRYLANPTPEKGGSAR